MVDIMSTPCGSTQPNLAATQSLSHYGALMTRCFHDGASHGAPHSLVVTSGHGDADEPGALQPRPLELCARRSRLSCYRSDHFPRTQLRATVASIGYNRMYGRSATCLTSPPLSCLRPSRRCGAFANACRRVPARRAARISPSTASSSSAKPSRQRHHRPASGPTGARRGRHLRWHGQRHALPHRGHRPVGSACSRSTAPVRSRYRPR